MVLYSEKGLQIYERITQTKAYYPFEAEKEILEKFGDEIASRVYRLFPVRTFQLTNNFKVHRHAGCLACLLR